MPMRPLKTDTETLCCIHWRTWPPLKAFEYHGQKGLDLYRAGHLDANEFQRFGIWERDCGLMRMEETKCRACKHVRRVEIKPPAVPTLVTMDGKVSTPIIDETFASNLPRFRSNVMTATRKDGDRHSKRDAAWVKQAQTKETPDET